MLLGTGSSGLLQANYKNVATHSIYAAGYFQDDWRVTPKLTLNLGLRYDIDFPRTERYNRTNYFDPDRRHSGVAQVIPGITGGLVFVGVNGVPRTQFTARPQQLGAALRPELAVPAEDGVARRVSRYVYGPSQQAAAGTIGTMGFRVDNTWVATIDGITPNDLLRNPYPRGVAPVVGAAKGVLTQFGNSHRSHHAGHRLAVDAADERQPAA